jgi:predicted enzyme related to lactoylglutathione lyase
VEHEIDVGISTRDKEAAMTEKKPEIGSIGWFDLTVADAEGVRDFYTQVVGWKPENVAMGDYSDYSMHTPGSGTPVAGVCHARGTNSGMPAQWMAYIIVEDADAAAARALGRGGKVLVGPKELGGARFCVIQDPAGAVCGLYQPKA